ncbi:FAD-dependent thiol oxidase, partial [Ceratobasidium sp. AG-I]
LPPGLVLGPDGKPCKVCNSVKSWSKAQRALTSKSSVASSTSPVAAAGAAVASTAAASSSSRDNCPADVEQLGRATWTFLHTTAAYYPESPTKPQQSHMLSLLRALPALYPCGPCATDFGEDLRSNPPEAAVLGRANLSKWLCERHNEVNSKLGKERFDCSVESLDTRWKDGPADGSCD